MPPGMPAKFSMLLGNLSRALADANKTTVVDVCSTWKDYVGGPEQIAEYVQRTTNSISFSCVECLCKFDLLNLSPP